MTLIVRKILRRDEFEYKLLSNESINAKDISIIIPVKNNQKGIENYLEYFFKTQNPKDFPKELIIIDNNSKPEIEIPNRFLRYGLNIKLLKCKKVGPAAARNMGAKFAEGKWLLFNDSDCLPTESIIKGYLKNNVNAIAYAGFVKAKDNDYLSNYYDTQEILLPPRISNNGNEEPLYLITANTLIYKQAFWEVGGFREEFRIAGGEDIDLSFKLRTIGKLAFTLESVVLHQFSDGLIGFYKRFFRYGQGNRLVQELWNVDLEPKPFNPNKNTFINKILAKIQYIALKKGYKNVKLKPSS